MFLRDKSVLCNVATPATGTGTANPFQPRRDYVYRCTVIYIEWMPRLGFTNSQSLPLTETDYAVFVIRADKCNNGEIFDIDEE